MCIVFAIKSCIIKFILDLLRLHTIKVDSNDTRPGPPRILRVFPYSETFSHSPKEFDLLDEL